MLPMGKVFFPLLVVFLKLPIYFPVESNSLRCTCFDSSDGIPSFVLWHYLVISIWLLFASEERRSTKTHSLGIDRD